MQSNRRKKISIIVWILVSAIAAYFWIVPCVIAIIHGIVMRNYSYEDYNAEIYLVYSDIASDYPREEIKIN